MYKKKIDVSEHRRRSLLGVDQLIKKSIYLVFDRDQRIDRTPLFKRFQMGKISRDDARKLYQKEQS